MTLKFAFNYLKKSHLKLKKLSAKGEGNILYLWSDTEDEMKEFFSLNQGAFLNYDAARGLANLPKKYRKRLESYK